MRRAFPEHLSCAGKRRYETWQRAARAARMLNHEHDETLEPYRCRFCQGTPRPPAKGVSQATGGRVMRGMREFRQAIAGLRVVDRETLERICDGVSLDEIATQDNVRPGIARARIGRVWTQCRHVPGLDRGNVGAICYRLGYEQALTDIEQRLKRKQAA